MYKYPYGDSQQLNLDWILAKIKDMEAAEASNLETISKALITLPYNTTTSYRRYDYAFLNGKLYRCLTDTSGVFNPTAWQEALIGDDLAVLTRWINAIDAAAVVDVKFDTSGTNGKLQQKYHDQYHDVVEVDYTPVQNSKRPLSSNAGYELNGAITSNENAIARVLTSLTASVKLWEGNNVFYNGVLYRVLQDVEIGTTMVVGTHLKEETYYGLPNAIYRHPSSISCTERQYNTLASFTLVKGVWALFGTHDWSSPNSATYQDAFFNSLGNVLGITRDVSRVNGGGAAVFALYNQTSDTDVVYYKTFGAGTAGDTNTAQNIFACAIRLY